VKEWLISGWIHLVLGFGIGWLIFKRPGSISAFIEKYLPFVQKIPLLNKII